MIYKNILTVMDFSDNTGEVLSHCIKLADKETSVCLIHSDPPVSGYTYIGPSTVYPGIVGFGDQEMIGSNIQSIKLEHSRQAMDSVKEELKKYDINADTRLFIGDEVEDILETAKEIKADLIIIGGHKHGFFSNLIFGNPEKAILNKTCCPVLVVPENRK